MTVYGGIRIGSDTKKKEVIKGLLLMTTGRKERRANPVLFFIWRELTGNQLIKEISSLHSELRKTFLTDNK